MSTVGCLAHTCPICSNTTSPLSNSPTEWANSRQVKGRPLRHSKTAPSTLWRLSRQHPRETWRTRWGSRWPVSPPAGPPVCPSPPPSPSSKTGPRLLKHPLNQRRSLRGVGGFREAIPRSQSDGQKMKPVSKVITERGKRGTYFDGESMLSGHSTIRCCWSLSGCQQCYLSAWVSVCHRLGSKCPWTPRGCPPPARSPSFWHLAHLSPHTQRKWTQHCHLICLLLTAGVFVAAATSQGNDGSDGGRKKTKVGAAQGLTQQKQAATQPQF